MSLDSIRKKDIGTTNPVPIGKYQKIVNNNAGGKQFANNTGAFENINNMNTVNKQSINNQFDNVKGVKPSWGSSLLDAFRKSDSTVKNFGGAVKKSFSPLVENTKKFINNFKPNANEDKEKTSTSNSQGNTFDNYWEEIHNQIKTNSLNSKNEVAMAQRKASQNMDNYLKALGIQNTGLGQSQYTSLASDYANAIADINKNEEQQLLDVEGQKRAEQDELKAEQDGKINQVMNYGLSVIENGGDPTMFIERMKELGASQEDIDYITNMYETYKNNSTNGLSDDDVYYNTQDLYSVVKNNLDSIDDVNERARARELINETRKALANKDYEALRTLYDELANIANGNSELNGGDELEVKIAKALEAKEEAGKALDEYGGIKSKLNFEYKKLWDNYQKAKDEYEKLLGIPSN